MPGCCYRGGPEIGRGDPSAALGGSVPSSPIVPSLQGSELPPIRGQQGFLGASVSSGGSLPSKTSSPRIPKPSQYTGLNMRRKDAIAYAEAMARAPAGDPD
ncbi:unnamed protein product, partial [Amoebophrya sp. A25]|eukprot:GSA25T00007578001.1